MRAHDGEITAISYEGGKLFTSGKDNKLCIFKDQSLEKSIDLQGSFAKGIDYLNGKILVGLRSGKIFEIGEASGDQKLLLNSHHEGESWGLDINPETNSVFTCGDDNKILEFDYKERRFKNEGVISDQTKPKNSDKAKKCTASTLSKYPVN